jgi:predicted DNA-binding mobile mystery protein A
MSRAQFGARLGGMRPQSVASIEQSEATGSIQLKTLMKAAEALDCTLVYALVPNSSLEGTINARARTIAMSELQRVGHTMRLEAQGTGDADLEARIADYIRDYLSERDLWSDR